MSTTSYTSYASPTSPRLRRQTVSHVPEEERSQEDSAKEHTPPMDHQSPLPKLRLNGSSNLHTGLSNEVPQPRLFGMPLKYISLITLAVQNALLTIIMHYSRVSIPPSQAYSAASAVLLNELLKGSISLGIAFFRLEDQELQYPHSPHPQKHPMIQAQQSTRTFFTRCQRLGKEIFSPDCWKLSIPAILYVIQNNLQFVAASNLEAATFQVSYQMKILTTAAFSVALLGKKLNATKWSALMALALGVGIVQIQSGSGNNSSSHSSHTMEPFTGFMAVIAACFTSGLAGVYFEWVLKGSKADLWVRNCQLSIFSLIPAILPILASQSTGGAGFSFSSIFANFGGWAWATVIIQVFGGLVTAIVIKYSDNILKGFATSLSIVISFLASVALFGFYITPSFVVGASTVLAATWLYNQPEAADSATVATAAAAASNVVSAANALPKLVSGVLTPSRKSSMPGTPVEADAPILGEFGMDEKRNGGGGGRSPVNGNGSVSPSVLAAALKLVAPRSSLEQPVAGHNEILDECRPGFGAGTGLGSRTPSVASLSEYQSRYVSRTHSPIPARVGTPPVPSMSRMNSSSSQSLSVPPPPSRLPSNQLSPYTQFDEKHGMTVSLNDSPGRSSR